MNHQYNFAPLAIAAQQPFRMEATGLEPGRPYVLRGASKRKPQHLWQRELCADGDGTVAWEENLPAPDEYRLDICAPGTERPAATGHVMALPDELACRIPLRCDFHMHTYYSDGKQSPTEMAVRGRELGLDLLAVTDHNRYAPSQEAMEGVAALGLDLICLPGEEVTFPDWHMLSIGASASVMDRYNSEAGQAEIAQVEVRLAGERLVPGLMTAEYAPARWAMETIHRYGGRAYLCHPYWVASQRFHLDPRIHDQLLADGVLDGLELLGDVEHEDNLLSLARYQDLLRQGQSLPIVSDSDAHGVEHTYGSYWTLVLAETKTAEGALRAIAEGYSAACSTAGATGWHEGWRAFGPFAVVAYALFLERTFFPMHNALCQQEAQAAYRALYQQGDRQGLRDAAQRLAQLYRRCFPGACG